MLQKYGFLVVFLCLSCTSSLAGQVSSLSIENQLEAPAAIAISSSSYTELKSRFGLSQTPVETIMLGGLNPALPMAMSDSRACERPENDTQQKSFLVSSGFPMGESVCRIYLVEQDQETQVIRTQQELIARFAPIESREEALSFLLAMEPSLTLALDGRPARVLQDGDDYEVALYDAQCNKVNEILSRVSRSGEINRLHIKQVTVSGLHSACDG